MSVPEQNMRTLMGWLSDDITGASSGAEQVTEDLATLVFEGDKEWPYHEDQAAGYAGDISAWLTADTESQFITLTAESGDPAAFISWMTPVLDQWKAPAAQDADRYDEATWDDNYGLSYRYDKQDEVYEWYDEQDGTWKDQAWADQYAASGSAQAAAAGAESQASAAAWDENWQMFYRIGPDGQYQYADAVVPGDESSGSSEVWLSYEQATTRAAPAPAGQETGQVADVEESQEEITALLNDPQQIQSIVDKVLEENRELAEIPEAQRDQVISDVLAELRKSVIG